MLPPSCVPAPCHASGGPLRDVHGAQAQMDYAVYDLDFTSEGRRRVCLFSYYVGK